MSSKYAALPDLDDSQDIYETPDLASDISTLLTSTSPTNSDIDASDLPRPSDSHAVFSGKRKGHAVYDDSRETPSRRLARLRREVEELRGELEAGGEAGRGVGELAEVLAQLGAQQGGAEKRLARKMVETLGAVDTGGLDLTSGQEKASEAQYTVTYSPHYKATHTLSRIADFDERLSVLEKVLGLPADGEALPTHAMIPALNDLQRQLGVLNSSSTASLDAAARRVKHLTAEAEKLTEARKAAVAGGDRDPLESLETVAKVNALYGVLPTIEKMAPMLPGTLDRLRSLRGIHGDAARASETLREVEERQEEMKVEVEKWEDALRKVEGVVKESRGMIESNVTKVEGWVREIETKMEKIGGL